MNDNTIINHVKIGISYEQLAHDFAIMKLNKKFNDCKMQTYGQLLQEYLEELEICRCILKANYGDDIFTK